MISDIALIFCFILIGGVFAAAEMSMVSLRESQVQQLASRGKRGQAIQRLTDNPNLFLSAVQIGVTVSGMLSAAFGGATIANALQQTLMGWGLAESVASPVSLIAVTVVISYFSIVVGELTAKRLAMQRAEAFALSLAPLVAGIARLTRPVIWFLDRSTNFLVRLLGGDPQQARDQVSDEELRAMLVSSTTLGDEERSIVDEIFEVGERSLREVMVPRTEVDFLAADLTIAAAYSEVHSGSHSRYPISDGSTDRIIGFVHVRDLMAATGEVREGTIRSIARDVLFLPETVKILRALSVLRSKGAHLAIVRDEYGGTAGLVTMEDLVEELIGDITDEYDEPTPQLRDVDEIDGLSTIEDFAEQTGLIIPEGPYDTLAGYFMATLGAVPQLGDRVQCELVSADQPEGDPIQITLQVLELDGRRAARFSIHSDTAQLVAADD